MWLKIQPFPSWLFWCHGVTRPYVAWLAGYQTIPIIVWHLSALLWSGTPLQVSECIIKIGWNSFCSNFWYHDPNRLQFCTYHDSSAVVVCAKLWPDLIMICCIKAMWTLTDEPLGYYHLDALWNGPQDNKCRFVIRFPQEHKLRNIKKNHQWSVTMVLVIVYWILVNKLLPKLMRASFDSSPQCRIYALMNQVSIGSDNGLPIRRQTII